MGVCRLPGHEFCRRIDIKTYPRAYGHSYYTLQSDWTTAAAPRHQIGWTLVIRARKAFRGRSFWASLVCDTEEIFEKLGLEYVDRGCALLIYFENHSGGTQFTRIE